MKFHITQRIFEMFPGLNVGVLMVTDADNSGAAADIQEMMREKEEEVRTRYTAEQLLQEPKITAWRNAYRLFGAKPKEHRSSVENLYRLVFEGKEIHHINQIVDIYNVVSLTRMLPVGGEDIDAIKGDIVLDLAGANEPPVLLLGDKEPRTPHEGEAIYKDDVSAICRRFNWREAERTKLTERTKNCILVVEGLPPVTRKEISAAVEELKTLITTYCAAVPVTMILDENNSNIDVKNSHSTRP